MELRVLEVEAELDLVELEERVLVGARLLELDLVELVDWVLVEERLELRILLGLFELGSLRFAKRRRGLDGSGEDLRLLEDQVL
jgi:hypothetical protein